MTTIPRFVLASVIATTACGGSASELPSGYDRGATVGALELELEAAGFTVDRGEFVFFEIEDCRGLPSCFGNNPSSPYGLFRLPSAPGEFTGGDVPPLSTASARTAYRLREDEAILFLGQTPPPSRYFSFLSYVTERGGQQVFGSFGPPANHLTLETSGPAEDPFEKETALVVTADQALASDLRSRLAARGLGSLVNVEPIPSDLVRLGLDANGDALTMLFRVALFDDAAAGRAYLDAPPAELLRIRPAAARAITPTNFAGYRERGTGTYEDDLLPGLDRLDAAIRASYAAQSPTTAGLILLNLVGSECIANGWRCNGDNPDTLYWGLVPRLLGPKDRIIVYGVDHRAAGKATYTNVSVYEFATLTGTAAVHDGEWAGSAASFLGAGDVYAEGLFAWTFARDCTGVLHCSVVPETFPGVAADAALTLVVRAYLEGATATAPYGDEVLGPRAIVVTMP